MALDMECPDCNKELECIDSAAFTKGSDYVVFAGVDYFVGILLSVVAVGLCSINEFVGFSFLVVAVVFYYYQYHQSRKIWLCRVCNNKFMGNNLKPLNQSRRRAPSAQDKH